jgi:hypothetical protein
VVQLRGELGNHLSAIAHGLGLQWELQRTYGIRQTQLVLRHQHQHQRGNRHTSHQKWKSTRDTLDACFPNLASLVTYFEGDNDNHNNNNNNSANTTSTSTSTIHSSIRSQQREWLTVEQQTKLHQVNGHKVNLYEVVTNESIHTGLQTFADLWNDPSRPRHKRGSSISIPYLLTSTLASNYMVDRYYEEIRDVFRLNETSSSCCALRADPEEIVFVRATDLD